METNIIDQINQNMDELIYNLDIKFQNEFNKSSVLLYLNNKLLFFNRISIAAVISFIEDKTINSPLFSYDLEVKAIQNKYFILAQARNKNKFDSDINDLLNQLNWVIAIELIPMLETLNDFNPISIENELGNDIANKTSVLINASIGNNISNRPAIDAKYYALYHSLRIKVGDFDQLPVNNSGSIIKSETVKIGEILYSNAKWSSGGSFYSAIKEINLHRLDHCIFGHDWKHKVRKIAEYFKNETVIREIDIF